LSLIYDLGTPISKFMRCGTMGYIAPEVVNNSEKSRKRYDTKSDMYGFGIIAHMLLLGSNPLRGKNYATTV
jgi:serine/threonine protein kinase